MSAKGRYYFEPRTAVRPVVGSLARSQFVSGQHKAARYQKACAKIFGLARRLIAQSKNDRATRARRLAAPLTWPSFIHRQAESALSNFTALISGRRV